MLVIVIRVYIYVGNLEKNTIRNKFTNIVNIFQTCYDVFDAFCEFSVRECNKMYGLDFNN